MHTFSNGGCRVYRFVSDLFHNNTTFASIKLCGVVFDSCPSTRDFCRGMRVFLSTCSQSFFVKYFLAACLLVWVVVLAIVSRCAECIPFSWIPADDYWEFMCEDPAVCPHLYLYSVVDTLVPYEEVEKMIAVRRSRGVFVLAQRWDDSTHVAHLMAHRETYMTACLDFLKRCLHTW